MHINGGFIKPFGFVAWSIPLAKKRRVLVVCFAFSWWFCRVFWFCTWLIPRTKVCDAISYVVTFLPLQAFIS